MIESFHSSGKTESNYFKETKKKDGEESNVQWREKKTRRQKAIRSIGVKCYTKSEENREGKTRKERNQYRRKIRKRRRPKKCRKYKVKILRKINK